MKKLKFIIYTRFFIYLAYYIIRIYSLTFRLKIENEEQWQDLLKRGDTILLCAWHQQFFSAIYHFKTYTDLNPALMISQSKDGDLIAGVAQRTGWRTARGSSSRNGKQAMDMMIDHLNRYQFGAHVLDGPRGPMGKIKAGIINMAHKGKARVVPFYTSASDAWFFKSWDRFMLPKPFSTVTITFDTPLHFPPCKTPDEFEAQRKKLETIMTPRLFLRP